MRPRPPPSQHHTQSQCLNQSSRSLDQNKLCRPLLRKDLSSKRRHTRDRKDHSTQPRRTPIAECSGSIQKRSESVGLDSGADEGGAVDGDDGGGLARADELFLRFGVFGTAVGLPEDGGHDSQVGGVGEDGAEGDGRGLDGGEVGEGVGTVRGQFVCSIAVNCSYEQESIRSHFEDCLDCLFKEVLFVDACRDDVPLIPSLPSL